ncbi:hypothetical protein HAHE_42560 [Haloferula helveola]|uniref:Uncharacterized protein n=1 Tax=Haloferula helveola TaxID=490095 RepID=A0ABN6HFV6_9BACT|nr:hypothetical protein HAHE_42560 [Haloferula helveola]
MVELGVGVLAALLCHKFPGGLTRLLKSTGGKIRLIGEAGHIQRNIPNGLLGDSGCFFLGNQNTFDRPAGSGPTGLPAAFQLLGVDSGGHGWDAAMKI